METRKQSKERAEAQAKAQAMEDTEDAKKKIPVHQAKIKRLNAKNKVKAALAQIKDAIEEFTSTEDSTSKELAANSIIFSRKRLVEGESELINATEDLAKQLGEADPTITEESSAQVLCTVSLLWDLLSLGGDTIRASSVAVEEIQELCCLAQSDGFKGPGKRLHKI